MLAPFRTVWMSNTPAGEDEQVEPPSDHPGAALDGDRYAHLPLEDGSVVIYDRQQPDTWVQSDHVVDVGGCGAGGAGPSG